MLGETIWILGWIAGVVIAKGKLQIIGAILTGGLYSWVLLFQKYLQ